MGAFGISGLSGLAEPLHQPWDRINPWKDRADPRVESGLPHWPDINLFFEVNQDRPVNIQSRPPSFDLTSCRIHRIADLPRVHAPVLELFQFALDSISLLVENCLPHP
jgi:hypothetical protein